MSYRKTCAEISQSALVHNIQLLKKIHQHDGISRSFFCPMIKANAYGHGDHIVSRILETHVSHFGVVLIEEGISLRKHGIQKPILVFGAFDHKSAVQACLEYNLTPVISSFEFLNMFSKEMPLLDPLSFHPGFKFPFKIHLKFDTGMSRLGFSFSETSHLKKELLSLKHLQVDGICTHFLESEKNPSEKGFTHDQLIKYAEIEKMFQGQYTFSHCLNSGALLNHLKPIEDFQKTSTHFGARPGLAIYGYHPNNDISIGLKPVMTLKSMVVQKKQIPKGQTVSYSATWTAAKSSDLAVIAIGYADGYLRGLSNQSHMSIKNKKVPVVGRICMDYCMVDLTDHPEKNQISVGDSIEVWGPSQSTSASAPSLYKLSSLLNTIPYELLTHVGARVPRIQVP